MLMLSVVMLSVVVQNVVMRCAFMLNVVASNILFACQPYLVFWFFLRRLLTSFPSTISTKRLESRRKEAASSSNVADRRCRCTRTAWRFQSASHFWPTATASLQRRWPFWRRRCRNCEARGDPVFLSERRQTRRWRASRPSSSVAEKSEWRRVPDAWKSRRKSVDKYPAGIRVRSDLYSML